MTTPPDFRALCAELLEKYDLEWRARERIKTALEAQPEPVGPTDEELQKTADALRDEDDTLSLIEYARAVLSRWGRPAIEPIPVSKRLPRPKDCDAEDQCWLWRTDGIEEFWELVVPPNKIHEYNWTSQWKYTHWLPFHALPIPRSEEILEASDE